MWVICGGMFRSGSTWQYEVANFLAQSRRQGFGVGYVSPQDFRPVLDRGRLHRALRALRAVARGARLRQVWRALQASLTREELYRVMKTHEGNAEITRLLGSGLARG